MLEFITITFMREQRRLSKVDQVTDKHKQSDKLGNDVEMIGNNLEIILDRDINSFHLRGF